MLHKLINICKLQIHELVEMMETLLYPQQNNLYFTYDWSTLLDKMILRFASKDKLSNFPNALRLSMTTVNLNLYFFSLLLFVISVSIRNRQMCMTVGGVFGDTHVCI